MKKLFTSIALTFLTSISLCTSANEVSRNNYVDWVLASSLSSSGSHLVQWENALNEECITQSGGYRTSISQDDQALFSLLLAAKLSNKKVGLVYSLTLTSGNIIGHGNPCQIINAWLESD